MDLFLNLAVETDELSLVKSVLECKHMNQHDIETVLTSMASKNLEIVILLFQAHSRLSPSVKDQQLRAVQTAFINNRFDLVELMFQHFPKLSPKVVKKLFSRVSQSGNGRRARSDFEKHEHPSRRISQINIRLYSHQKITQMSLEVLLLSENATLPTRGSPQAAGLDLSSAIDCVVPCRGCLLLLRSRSRASLSQLH